MKYRVVACGVFEPYLRSLAEDCPNTLDITCLDAGLHERPNDLRLMLQEEIDRAEGAGVDAVILFYGLCGRGAAGIVARSVPVVIPRAHDCITLFLGSAEAYRRQFALNPGTFYHTMGWIDKKINPRNRHASELYADYARAGFDTHPDFEQLRAKYGDDNAEHILSFLQSWRRNYSRAAYIDLGFDGESEYARFTRDTADVLGWQHEIIDGDPDLMRQVLAGEWDDARVLVIPPGARSIATGDDAVLAVVAMDSSESDTTFSDGEVVIEERAGCSGRSGIGLGIDAGGTYTDAVIYDLGAGTVLAKAKSLTTYSDLLIGVRAALEQLPADHLREVAVTSLSTTLATNSIVEGRGHKVGLIALSPWGWTEQQVGHAPLINVPGSVTITGEVHEPLDEAAAERAARRLVEHEHCAAIAVAGYATLRNPEQANRVREIILGLYDIPVVCAHEVSRRLNGIHAAQTAVANASLLPVVHELIESVHAALRDLEIPGRLMVVKGDGTPVSEDVARARPVETILSGPAASVSGARALTGIDDAMVLDIGGTTTDCAIIENGHVEVSEDGARIGSWVMSVDAAEITTAGLGGDSRIDFTRDRRITIGPRRNLPLCYIADQYQSAKEWLATFDSRRHAGDLDASAIDFLALGGSASIALTQREEELISLLESGPLPSAEAARMLDVPSAALLPTARLESCGILKRAGLTPTDLLHVTGAFTRWDSSSATLALRAFAGILGRSPEETLDLAMTAVTRRLFEEIVRREVTRDDPKLHEIPADWEFLMDSAFAGKHGLLVSLGLRRPIIAIGAPADALVPPVARRLQAAIVVPEHADVANAVGAIASRITIREEVLIRPGQFSNYLLYGTNERIEFAQLEKATEKAVDICRERALERAKEAGAIDPEVRIMRSDSGGSTSDGARLFLERRVTAVASGGAFAPSPAPV